ncbi:MAG: phenylacetate--CoA ligase family protein [Burkholderiales bacterium]
MITSPAYSLDNLPTPPLYSDALDFNALYEEFPPAPKFFQTTYRLPPDQIRKLQEKRFLEQVARGWQVPFYQKLWGKAGLKPGDIRSLADIEKIPPYTVHDLRESIERNPPWGDYWGVTLADGATLPMVLQTSGGTTGLPRPMIYAPRDREVMAIMGGRRLLMQGVRPGDLIQVTMSLGLTNAGMMVREYIWKYTGAVPLMTGSGAATPTRRQLELMQAWKPTVLIGIPSYVRHLGLVARDELKIDPRSLGIRVILAGLGPEPRDALEDMWGARVMQQYGTNESGMMAAECPYQNGFHIFEDAYLLEIADPETNRPVPTGDKGNIYITCLFKHAAPVIRFNSNDVSAIATDVCPCGGTHRRLQGIFGRADNMVRLRGINVFPEAIATVVVADPRCNGEYFCEVHTVGADRDELTVKVEVRDASVDRTALKNDLQRRMKEVLSVTLNVEPVDAKSLDKLTGLSSTSKIKRLADNRAVKKL